jgi:hypothetical protein
VLHSICCKNITNTLLKAVPIINNRGLISSVQKAGRASERAKKRAAMEVKEEANGEASEEDNSKALKAYMRARGRAAKRVRFSKSTKRGASDYYYKVMCI